MSSPTSSSGGRAGATTPRTWTPSATRWRTGPVRCRPASERRPASWTRPRPGRGRPRTRARTSIEGDETIQRTLLLAQRTADAAGGRGRGDRLPQGDRGRGRGRPTAQRGPRPPGTGHSGGRDGGPRGDRLETRPSCSTSCTPWSGPATPWPATWPRSKCMWRVSGSASKRSVTSSGSCWSTRWLLSRPLRCPTSRGLCPRPHRWWTSRRYLRPRWPEHEVEAADPFAIEPAEPAECDRAERIGVRRAPHRSTRPRTGRPPVRISGPTRHRRHRHHHRHHHRRRHPASRWMRRIGSTPRRRHHPHRRTSRIRLAEGRFGRPSAVCPGRPCPNSCLIWASRPRRTTPGWRSWPTRRPAPRTPIAVRPPALSAAQGPAARRRLDRSGDTERVRRNLGLVLPVAAAVVVLDQLTKTWALRALADGPVDLVWTLRFNLTFNTGAAFSQFTGLGPRTSASSPPSWRSACSGRGVPCPPGRRGRRAGSIFGGRRGQPGRPGVPGG